MDGGQKAETSGWLRGRKPEGLHPPGIVEDCYPGDPAGADTEDLYVRRVEQAVVAEPVHG